MDRAYSFVGLILSVLLFLSFFLILASEPFPANSFRHGELVPISPSGGVGPAVSGFLWGYRGFDLLMQALLLFATAMCCMAMLREERR